MSDSGRVAGDCEHGHSAEWCPKCLRDRVAKLQAFKDWVHGYLDGKGVPHHPPGTHGAEGCRIGDRMDWAWAELARLRAELDETRRHWSEDTRDLNEMEAEIARLRADRAALVAALAKMIALARKFSDGQSMMGTTAAAESVLAMHGGERPAAE